MISRQKLIIPTYEMEDAEPSPIFYDVRNHQGTRGNVYPIPMRDSFCNVRKDREYDAVVLENEYIRVTALPELGGRIYEGYDKKADYHFVYKNHVIKPALIGLAGAWISGGIEFNWPQHHRPTTYMPVDCRVETGEDGSETVWMGEYEPLFGMKGMVGVTIWPDKAYVTVKTRLYNPTNATQTFHWWANLAVAANQNYQLKFPPDIDYITYHYKDAVSEFPVVKGEFARADFGEGTDITWFKNIPSPASFFILNSDYNFMGGYDHGRQRGTVHVADHNVSVGKKFFTWGSREFGDVWHSNLTDEDGAYLEIMTGCYTDNQPDFSFMVPDETKTFEQTWYAITDMPDLKNAEKGGAVGFSVEDGILKVSLNVTSHQKDAHICITVKGENVYEGRGELVPGQAWKQCIQVLPQTEEKDIAIRLTDQSGETVIAYEYRKPFFEERKKPQAHKPARRPQEISSQEELYLEGLHLEQYRHVTLRPAPYYEEALRRDPGDIRCNNAMGLLMMKQGRVKDALAFFEKAVERSTFRNPNPREGEAYFNYAWALEENGQTREAMRCYRKAAWNYGFKGAGLKQAAKLAFLSGETEEAMNCLREALCVNAESPQLHALYAYGCRKLGRMQEAHKVNERMLGLDPLAYGSLAEAWLLSRETGEAQPEERKRMLSVLGQRRTAWLTLLADYLEIGDGAAALALAELAPKDAGVYFYMAYASVCAGDMENSNRYLEQAERGKMDYVFPYTDMDKRVLRYAQESGDVSGRSAYLLGCLYYGRDNREEGLRYWEKAVCEKPDMYQAHRALALALLDVNGDKAGARREMEKAFAIEQEQSGGAEPNGRYLLELLKIRKSCGVPAEKLLDFLERYPNTVNRKEELAHQRLVLCNEAGKPEKAAQYLKERIFNPYEGGEGILIRAHILAYIQMGRRAVEQENWEEAIACYEKALEYPDNYQEGRGVNAREAAVYYHMACVLEAMGKEKEALEWYGKAAEHKTGQLDESDFYTGCALRRLGREREASLLYLDMHRKAKDILKREEELPYFGGFVSNLPTEHSVKIANHRKAHPAAFYALTGLGLYREAQKEKELAIAWGAETAWLKIIEKDGGYGNESF